MKACLALSFFWENWSCLGELTTALHLKASTGSGIADGNNNSKFSIYFHILHFWDAKKVLLEENNFWIIQMFCSEHICCLSVVKDSATETACV